MKAFILAAGRGMRLRPFTDFHPKALTKVNGISLLERNIRYLQSFGFQDFVINIHHFGNQILDFLDAHDNFGSRIEISDETDSLLETGGGLVFARPFLDRGESFLVMNVDILTDLDIADFVRSHEENHRLVSLAVSDREGSRKLLFNHHKILKGWMNEQTGEVRPHGLSEEVYEKLSFSGIHCIDPRFFSKIKRSGMFSIMEEYLDLVSTEEIYGYVHQAVLIDVGRASTVVEAEKYFK
ncbi:MAG: nucleotidyltransferase family protein [Bergeyella sp.]|nr:nucleotidyltransferase family protein [Bergeyella sp.]